MAMYPRDLWTWRGVMGRGDYLLWGGVLFAVKYNFDRLIASAFFGERWLPWTYLTGRGSALRPPAQAARDLELYWVLALLALPFVFWGVMMTLRRLRDAGWSQVLVVLFFVPFVNLFFFAFLCLQPTREPPPVTAPPLRWWQHALP